MVDWKKLSKGLAHNGLLGVGLLALCFSYRWQIPEYTRLVSYGITVTGFYISAAYHLASEPKNDDDDDEEEDEDIKRTTEAQPYSRGPYSEVEYFQSDIDSELEESKRKFMEEFEAQTRKFFTEPEETSELSEDQRKKCGSFLMKWNQISTLLPVQTKDDEILEYLKCPNVGQKAEDELRVTVSLGTMKRSELTLPEPGDLTSASARREYLQTLGTKLKSAKCYRMLKRRPSVSRSEVCSGEEEEPVDIKYLTA